MALEQVKVFPSDDPRLDWVSKHDSRSLNYTLERLKDVADVGEVDIRPRRWSGGVTLDQGREGACVGFGWTQEFLSSPRPYHAASAVRANEYAREFYYRCRQVDEWPGENYDGTSVLAGAQVAVERGLIESYWWCTSIEDVRDAVIELGPVVIGIPWYYNMYFTRESGLVEPSGDLVGGHCILIDEYHPGKRLSGESWSERFHGFGWHNSWGDGYGVGGRGFIRYEDLRDLLARWGEACVPMGRKLVRF